MLLVRFASLGIAAVAIQQIAENTSFEDVQDTQVCVHRSAHKQRFAPPLDRTSSKVHTLTCWPGVLTSSQLCTVLSLQQNPSHTHLLNLIDMRTDSKAVATRQPK